MSEKQIFSDRAADMKMKISVRKSEIRAILAEIKPSAIFGMYFGKIFLSVMAYLTKVPKTSHKYFKEAE